MELPEAIVHVGRVPRERGHAAVAAENVTADIPARLFEQRGRGLSGDGHGSVRSVRSPGGVTSEAYSKTGTIAGARSPRQTQLVAQT